MGWDRYPDLDVQPGGGFGHPSMDAFGPRGQELLAREAARRAAPPAPVVDEKSSLDDVLKEYYSIANQLTSKRRTDAQGESYDLYPEVAQRLVGKAKVLEGYIRDKYKGDRLPFYAYYSDRTNSPPYARYPNTAYFPPAEGLDDLAQTIDAAKRFSAINQAAHDKYMRAMARGELKGSFSNSSGTNKLYEDYIRPWNNIYSPLNDMRVPSEIPIPNYWSSDIARDMHHSATSMAQDIKEAEMLYGIGKAQRDMYSVGPKYIDPFLRGPRPPAPTPAPEPDPTLDAMRNLAAPKPAWYDQLMDTYAPGLGSELRRSGLPI